MKDTQDQAVSATAQDLVQPAVCDEAPSTTPDPASAPAKQGKRAGSRARCGAPAGNTNALSHGLYSKSAEAKRRATKYRRVADAEGAAILAELGLGESPTACRVVRRMVQAEVESAILEKYVESRGRHDKNGALKPAYSRMLDLRHTDLADCRRLLEQLATLGNPDETHVVRIVEAEDGAA